MAQDRITALHVQGVRVLKDLHLKLNPLTVLIGENGVGKSTIVEVLALLSRATRDSFIEEFYSVHQGFFGLRRRGSDRVTIGIDVEGEGPRLHYEFTLIDENGSIKITAEVLLSETPDGNMKEEFARDSAVPPKFGAKAPFKALYLGLFAHRPSEPIRRVLKALESIDVHLPFQTTPTWAARRTQSDPPMRKPMLLQPADRVSLFGANLANAFHALKNDKPREHWEKTLDYVRLGLGYDIDNVNTRVDPGGGAIALTIQRKGVAEQEPSYVLSDGQLSYLALVAIYRLETPFSLLVFDEPDLHLHPGLIVRMLSMFESMAERGTVLLTTHSDRILDSLQDPVSAARLLELGPDRATRVMYPNEEVLRKWLDEYGLGTLRSEGHESLIFSKEQPSS